MPDPAISGISSYLSPFLSSQEIKGKMGLTRLIHFHDHIRWLTPLLPWIRQAAWI
jgi:hypothetical protein